MVAGMRCGSCGSKFSPAARTCGSCGAALEPPSADLLGALAVERLRKARTWILAVGLLYAAGGLLFWALGRGADEAHLVLGVNLFLTAVHVGLWVWARSAPFAAAVVALVLFVTLHVASAVLEPASILQGIPVKVLFIVALFQAVSTASTVRRLRAEAAGDGAPPARGSTPEPPPAAGGHARPAEGSTGEDPPAAA